MAKRKKVSLIDTSKTQKSIDDVKKQVDNLAKDIEIKSSKVRTEFEKMFNVHTPDTVRQKLLSLAQQEGLTAKETSDLRVQMDLLNRSQKKTSDSTDLLSGNIKTMLASFGGAYALKSFVGQMTNIRGEMEAMEKSFEVLLDGKEKADTMVGQLVDYAVATPFKVGELSNATQTLLGFNVEAEKVIPLLRQMGDISMGNSQRFQSLALAFAQMYGAGQLRGQELMQMINAGFNPLQVLAEKTGKSIADLKAEMSKGAISTKMIEDAFRGATSEGGRFYGMMEKNAGGINNLRNQMTGAFEEVFNKLGRENEGAIKGYYKTGILIAENYKTIGKILTSLIATYGAYRAALVLTSAIERIRYQATLAQMAGMTKLQAITTVLKEKTALLNKTMLANPYVLVTTLVVGAAAAMWTLADSTTAAERAQKKFNEAQEEERRKAEERKQNAEELISLATDETKGTVLRTEALNSLIEKYPELIQKYIDEKNYLKDIVGFRRELSELERKESVKKNLDTVQQLKDKLAQLEESYQNPNQTTANRRAIGRAYEDTTELLKLAEAKVAQDRFTEWSLSLKKYSKEQLEEELEENKARYAKATEEEKKLINKKQGVIQAELSLRAPKSIYKQDFDNAKKEWEDAKKAYEEIQKDKSKFFSFQFEEAKKALEDAEDRYKSLGGKIEVNKTAEFSFTEYLQGLDYNARKSATKDRLEQLKIDEEKAVADNLKLAKEKNLTAEQTEKAELLIREKYANERLLIQEEELKKEQDKLQKEQEARDKSLEAFEAYEVQKQAIIDKYAELRKNATEKHDVSLIDKAEKEELEGLSDKFKPQIEAQIIDLTRAKVSELIVELNRLRDEISKESDPKVVESLQNRIDSILNKLQTKSPFVAFKENIKEAFEGGKVDFTKLGNAIDDVLPSLQAVANDARALFGDGVGDSLDGFLQAVDGFSDLSKSVGAFVGGDIMGGVAGLLSAGNKLFGGARKVNAEHREALRLLRLQKQEIENQVALSELRAKLEGKINIFGTDKWGQTKRVADTYLNAKEKLDNAMIGNTKNETEIAKLQAIRDKSHDRRQKTALTDRIKKLQEEQKSTLEQMQVVNGSEKKRVGLFRKKRVDTWGSILDEYKDLVEEDGKLNIALAESIMRTSKMKDKDKIALQDLIDNAHIMEDAMSQIASNLRDIFGELGQTIMDYFEEAARSGVNDFSKVEEAGSKMVERLAKEMIFSVLLGDLIDEYTEKMKATQISDKSDEEKILDFQKITEDFVAGGLATQGKYEELINNLKDSGINISDSDKQDTSRGVQRNVSQDTMDEVNGRLTAVQISNESIAESTRIMAESSRRSIETMSSISSMMQIGTYAWQDIANYTSVLPGMAKDMAEVKRNTRGLIK